MKWVSDGVLQQAIGVPCKIVIIYFGSCVLLNADLTIAVDSFVRVLPGLHVSVYRPMHCCLGEGGRRMALASASW